LSSRGFFSATTGAGRLSFFFLRSRDFGMAAGYTTQEKFGSSKGWADE